MLKPKILIVRKKVVRDIRAGLDDAALMRKYGISARGVERLFEKLIGAGEIDREEFDKRMLSSQQSHVVELETLEAPILPKKVIRTSEAIGDIRSGMTETSLMEKYNLSARGVESLFRRLVETGKMTRSELRSRMDPAESPKNPPAGYAGGFLTEDDEFEPEEAEGPSGTGRMPDRYKLALSIAAGMVAGAALAAVFFIYMPGGQASQLNEPEQPSTSLMATVKALRMQAEDLIRILEAIAKDPEAPRGHSSSAEPHQSAQLQRCLEECDKSVSAPDDDDKILVLNCKKECLSKYSERVRKIRERFYDRP
jgi:hypothetical protein